MRQRHGLVARPGASTTAGIRGALRSGSKASAAFPPSAHRKFAAGCSGGRIRRRSGIRNCEVANNRRRAGHSTIRLSDCQLADARLLPRHVRSGSRTRRPSSCIPRVTNAAGVWASWRWADRQCRSRRPSSSSWSGGTSNRSNSGFADGSRPADSHG